MSDSSGIIAGNTRVNDIGLSMLEASLMQMDVGPQMCIRDRLFHQPEAFLKLGNRLLVLQVPDEPTAGKPRTKPPAEHDR